MPSEKVLQEKQQLVEGLAEKCKNAVTGVLVDYKGINVADDTALRKELRESNVDYFVVKNTMLRFAFNKIGFESLNETLGGSTAVAISTEDPIMPAKIVAKYSNKLPKEIFNIKGGFMDGAPVELSTVEALAKIPSKETLIAQMLSSLNAPIANLAVVLNQIAEKSA